MKNETIEFSILKEKLAAGVKNQKSSGMAAAGDGLIEDGALKRVEANLDKLFRYHEIGVDPTIATRKKGLTKKLVVLFKRFCRKVVAWYLQPVCDLQTRYNYQVYLTAVEIKTFLKLQMKEQQEQVREYQEQMQEHQEQMEAILQKQKEYEEQMQEIQKQMRELGQMQEEQGRKLQEKRDVAFWNKRTTSQAGEDAIIAYILRVLGICLQEEKYLDLGANHAQELSNTYMLYEEGMRGVLVEANPGLIPELQFLRKGDVILNRCVSVKSGENVSFYVLNGDGLSSPDKESVEEALEKNPELKIEKIVDVESIAVNEILEKYFEKPPILMNIDIEGKEDEIMSSIDFSRFAPFIIVVERIEYNTQLVVGKRKDGLEELMKEKGYVEYAFTGINSVFLNKEKLEEYQR